MAILVKRTLRATLKSSSGDGLVLRSPPLKLRANGEGGALLPCHHRQRDFWAGLPAAVVEDIASASAVIAGRFPRRW